jgi:hypothetical protein
MKRSNHHHNRRHHHHHHEADDGHSHSPGTGHNHHHDHDHLHSHVHVNADAERAEAIGKLADTFVDSFRKASDKQAFLKLAGIPSNRKGSDGLTMHLVDVAISTNWQVGTASPAFASKELTYLPYPGEMIRERETMTFTYVSMTAREDVDLIELMDIGKI